VLNALTNTIVFICAYCRWTHCTTEL